MFTSREASEIPALPFQLGLPYGVLTVQGPDARKFLQGQITANVATLADGDSTLAACCTPQGRIRALFIVFARDDVLHLVMPRAVVPRLLEALKKYAVFFKAQLSDQSDLWQVLGVAGDAAVDAACSHTLHTDPMLRVLLSPAGAPRPALPQADLDSWERLAILLGHAEISEALIETQLPGPLGLAERGAIHFDKGCYTGQEIVARMHYRGSLKTHLQKARCASNTPLPAGAAVVSGERAVGEVLRSAPSRSGGQLVLLSLQDSAVSETLHAQNGELPILELITA